MTSEHTARQSFINHLADRLCIAARDLRSTFEGFDNEANVLAGLRLRLRLQLVACGLWFAVFQWPAVGLDSDLANLNANQLIGCSKLRIRAK